MTPYRFGLLMFRFDHNHPRFLFNRYVLKPDQFVNNDYSGHSPDRMFQYGRSD